MPYIIIFNPLYCLLHPHEALSCSPVLYIYFILFTSHFIYIVPYPQINYHYILVCVYLSLIFHIPTPTHISMILVWSSFEVSKWKHKTNKIKHYSLSHIDYLHSLYRFDDILLLYLFDLLLFLGSSHKKKNEKLEGTSLLHTSCRF